MRKIIIDIYAINKEKKDFWYWLSLIGSLGILFIALAELWLLEIDTTSFVGKIHGLYELILICIVLFWLMEHLEL